MGSESFDVDHSGIMDAWVFADATRRTEKAATAAYDLEVMRLLL